MTVYWSAPIATLYLADARVLALPDGSVHCAPHDAVPCVVLDPFCGTGTTCVAAQRLGRRSIGVDLKGEYLALAVKRLTAVPLPLLKNEGGG